MASLERQASGIYTLRFYFGKRKYNRSLNTTHKKTALAIKAEAEETIRLLKRGVWSLPSDATYDEAGEFIVSGGNRLSKPSALRDAVTLAEAKAAYFDAIPEGGKEGTSLSTEKTHAKHIIRLLKGSTPMEAIREPELQSMYINKRVRQKGKNGNLIQPGTIQKEMQTFFQIRDFAKSKGWVKDELERKRLVYPKPNAKPPFKTWSEIEAAIKRGGLSDEQIEELWDSLFLGESEVLNLVAHVNENAEHDFILPMFAVAAFTGARRSEILRAQVDDFPLDGGPCWIREKKRRKQVSISFRQVPMLPPLKEVLENWLEKHPGGNHLICTPPKLRRGRTASDLPEPLSVHQAAHFFKSVLADSKWEVVRGFHTLRHSFASICAQKGVPQQVIDSWMGHQTQEMRERYRHLFPEQSERAATTVFQDCGLFRKRG
jgi:integrase